MTNNTVCIDANLVVFYLTNNNPNSIYQQKWTQWQANNYTLVAPTLIMYEVTNAFHRAIAAGQISRTEGESLLENALNLGIRFYGDAELHKQALAIAQTYNLPATYDAHYLALAQRLNVELWTADRRLFNSIQSSFSWVNLLV